MRLRQMMDIGGSTVSAKFTKNFRASTSRMFECFEANERGAFPQGQPVTMRIEGPAPRRRDRLKRIKACEHKMAQCIVAAGKNTLGLATLQQMPGVANCIRP